MGASQKMVDTHGTFRLGDTEFENLKLLKDARKRFYRYTQKRVA